MNSPVGQFPGDARAPLSFKTALVEPNEPAGRHRDHENPRHQDAGFDVVEKAGLQHERFSKLLIPEIAPSFKEIPQFTVEAPGRTAAWHGSLNSEIGSRRLRRRSLSYVEYEVGGSG